MGLYSGGILGSFSGKVGAVIGSNWKGISYMRGRAPKGNRTPTQAQLDAQKRFAVLVLFLDILTSYLDITFRNYAVQMTPNNAAFSYNKSAITGVSPDFSVDYTKVAVSRGKLLNAATPAVAVAGNVATFTWKDNSGSGGNVNPTDIAMPLVFCAALNQCNYSTNATRKDGTLAVDVSLFAGQKIQTWLAFVAADGTDASASVYLGEVGV